MKAIHGMMLKDNLKKSEALEVVEKTDSWELSIF
jgi:hypothetical protein